MSSFSYILKNMYIRNFIDKISFRNIARLIHLVANINSIETVITEFIEKQKLLVIMSITLNESRNLSRCSSFATLPSLEVEDAVSIIARKFCSK